jgi:hypothetical protein
MDRDKFVENKEMTQETFTFMSLKNWNSQLMNCYSVRVWSCGLERETSAPPPPDACLKTYNHYIK